MQFDAKSMKDKSMKALEKEYTKLSQKVWRQIVDESSNGRFETGVAHFSPIVINRIKNVLIEQGYTCKYFENSGGSYSLRIKWG